MRRFYRGVYSFNLITHLVTSCWHVSVNFSSLVQYKRRLYRGVILLFKASLSAGLTLEQKRPQTPSRRIALLFAARAWLKGEPACRQVYTRYNTSWFGLSRKNVTWFYNMCEQPQPRVFSKYWDDWLKTSAATNTVPINWTVWWDKSKRINWSYFSWSLTCRWYYKNIGMRRFSVW